MSQAIANPAAYVANPGSDASAPVANREQNNNTTWQSEYISASADPAFVRAAFEAMQPTGCLDTDMQNLGTLLLADGVIQERATNLFNGAAEATKSGNIAATVGLRNAAEMALAGDDKLHAIEHEIEDEESLAANSRSEEFHKKKIYPS